jgi:DNA (cytosine-5)-methyltransferase 1
MDSTADVRPAVSTYVTVYYETGDTMKRKALGVYIFAGGFTVGVKKHFDVDTHFEDGSYGVDTSKLNKVIKQAYTNPDEWPVKQYAGKVDFLYANPPCAPWSMCSAGRQLHWTEDPRVNAVKRTFALIDTIKPKVWAWESVRPTFVKGRDLVDAVCAEGMKRGYAATVLMVNGLHHGVPQFRRRMFVVLSKVDIPWEKGSTKVVTVRDVMKKKFKTQTIHPNLAPASIKKFFKITKPGERPSKIFDKRNPDKLAQHVPGQTKMQGRPSFQWRRLHWDEPAQVLTGGCLSLHPDENRTISVEESAALCGYPDGFKFVGSLGKQYAQVAQAVMPPVGEYLARMVKKGLDKGIKVKPTYHRVEITGEDVIVEPLKILGGKMSLEIIATPPKPAYHGSTKPPVARARATGHVGIGVRMRQLLSEGNDVVYTLNQIKKEFPQSKATRADVYWNRRKLETQGGVP